MTDLLANAERPRGDQPPPSREPEPAANERPWLGSATSEVRALRARVAALEAEVARLRGQSRP